MESRLTDREAMSYGSALILTEESLTQSDKAGLAAEVFQGSFGEVARLARAASQAVPTTLLIASGKHGLIQADARIEPYDAGESQAEVVERAVREARRIIDSHEGVLVLALQGRLLRILLEDWQSRFAGDAFVTAGRDSQSQIETCLSHARVRAYPRAGVARLGRAATDAILAKLGAKTAQD